MGQDGSKVWTYKRDGTRVEWTGKQVAYCTHCEELFASNYAFDHHLKRKGRKGKTEHDFTGMPRNSRGHLVVELRPKGEIIKTDAAQIESE